MLSDTKDMEVSSEKPNSSSRKDSIQYFNYEVRVGVGERHSKVYTSVVFRLAGPVVEVGTQ